MRYEYLTKTILVMAEPAEEIDKELNVLGLNDWELVAVIPGQGRAFVFFFKRELKETTADDPGHAGAGRGRGA